MIKEQTYYFVGEEGVFKSIKILCGITKSRKNMLFIITIPMSEKKKKIVLDKLAKGGDVRWAGM